MGLMGRFIGTCDRIIPLFIGDIRLSRVTKARHDFGLYRRINDVFDFFEIKLWRESYCRTYC